MTSAAPANDDALIRAAGRPGRLVLPRVTRAAFADLALWMVGLGVVGHVATAIRHATDTGDWSGCDENRCRLTADSDGELGDSARAFNELIGALARSNRVEAAIRDLFQTLSSHLELDQLADAALGWVAGHFDVLASALLLCRDGTLKPAATQGPIDAGALCGAPELNEALRARTPLAL